MQNKRYIRLAKRMKAYCSDPDIYCSIGSIKVCPYYNKCFDLKDGIVPKHTNLRSLEKACKGV